MEYDVVKDIGKKAHKYRYHIMGVHVASSIRLPLNPVTNNTVSSSVIIELGGLPKQLSGKTISDRFGRQAGYREFLETEPEYGYYVKDGRFIFLDPLFENFGDDIKEFIVINAFRKLLQQRGKIGFHASAVNIHGQAAVFMGTSGSGKSTTATALSLEGYELLSDDICIFNVSEQDRVPEVVPYCPRVHLRADAFDKLSIDNLQYERISDNTGYYRTHVPSSNVPVPLAKIFHLCTKDVVDVNVQKLSKLNSFKKIVDHCMLFNGPIDSREEIELKKRLLILSHQSTVFSIIRPRGKNTIENVVGQIKKKVLENNE